jgi:hypothetical protein
MNVLAAKARLREFIEQDPEIRQLLASWTASLAMAAQDQAVSELTKPEPREAVAIQQAATSKAYEGMLGQLQEFLKEKVT